MKMLSSGRNGRIATRTWQMKFFSSWVQTEFITRHGNEVAYGMRILVIEDEQKVSALVKRGLTAERYAVDVTADGVEGLEFFEAFPYDLVILDLMLPRLPGS